MLRVVCSQQRPACDPTTCREFPALTQFHNARKRVEQKQGQHEQAEEHSCAVQQTQVAGVRQAQTSTDITHICSTHTHTATVWVVQRVCVWSSRPR